MAAPPSSKRPPAAASAGSSATRCDRRLGRPRSHRRTRELVERKLHENWACFQNRQAQTSQRCDYAVGEVDRWGCHPTRFRLAFVGGKTRLLFILRIWFSYLSCPDHPSIVAGVGLHLYEWQHREIVTHLPGRNIGRNQGIELAMPIGELAKLALEPIKQGLIRVVGCDTSESWNLCQVRRAVCSSWVQKEAWDACPTPLPIA